MGVFEYLKHWVSDNGTVDADGMAQNVAGIVLVDQAPSDFKWPGYDYDAFSLEDLAPTVAGVQTDQLSVVEGFVPEMLQRSDRMIRTATTTRRPPGWSKK